MAIEPLEYARPQTGAGDYDPIRFTQTETGFLLEIDPSPASRQFGCVLAVIAIGMVVAMIAVSFILSALVLIGAFVIMVSEKQMVDGRRDERGSFELDAGEFIVHYDFRREVLSWQTIAQFEVKREEFGKGARVVAMLSEASEPSAIELYRSTRIGDVDRIVQLLNHAKNQTQEQA